MQRLGVAGNHHGFVDDDLPEAAPRDRAERLSSRHLGLDLDLTRLFDGDIRFGEELEAALGLGLDGKPERHPLGQRAGEREQLSRIAALKLELDFADGHPTLTRY